ncbi:ChaN family lipoprotein [Planctomycetota bacterium]|nr:ChaN family lipoprotein [Planctomycetota bacterium]
MGDSRNELIRIQKHLVEEMKESIYDTVGRRDAALDRYYREYVAEFRDGFDRPAARSELLLQLQLSQIAYFGDYHTLRDAQDAVLGLLTDSTKEGRKIVLALEMIHAEHNHLATQLLSGEITDVEFRDGVEYEESWGFPWSSFGRYFDFAREHESPIYGININADGHDGDLRYRDRYAATLVGALTQLYPDHLVAVVYGDLHLAGNHLPARVDDELRRFGKEHTSVRIYQNSETMYWNLADIGREQLVDAVKIKPHVYNLNRVPPLVKFQSFLTWQGQRAARMPAVLDEFEFELFDEMTQLEQVATYAKTIAEFLGIDAGPLDDFELSTAADLDMLSNLVRRGIYTASEMQALKEYLAMAKTAYFERAGVVYIQDYTPANAAEGAARYLLARLRPTSNEVVENIDEFYSRVMVEALAYFCSRVIDSSRRAANEDEWQATIEKYKRRRKLGDLQRLDVHVARACLRHVAYEARVQETGSMAGAPRKLFEQETAEHVYTTRSLGRRLGNKLFDAVQDETVDRALIRDCAGDNLRERDVSRQRYFELLDLLNKRD